MVETGTADGSDIGAAMAASGWARAFTRYSVTWLVAVSRGLRTSFSLLEVASRFH
jgi:hypothetical protein